MNNQLNLQEPGRGIVLFRDDEDLAMNNWSMTRNMELYPYYTNANHSTSNHSKIYTSFFSCNWITSINEIAMYILTVQNIVIFTCQNITVCSKISAALSSSITWFNPTEILSISTVANCCLVPINMNSVLSSLSISLSEIIQFLMPVTHSFMDFTAISALIKKII